VRNGGKGRRNMRKDLHRVSKESFQEALKLLGYTKCREDGSEWRHQQFHLFIHERGKRGLALSIHEDAPSPFPPFHRAIPKSKLLGKELAKIEEAYKRRRAATPAASKNKKLVQKNIEHLRDEFWSRGFSKK